MFQLLYVYSQVVLVRVSYWDSRRGGTPTPNLDTSCLILTSGTRFNGWIAQW